MGLPKAQWTEIQIEVNAMNDRLCRLETIEPRATPIERRTIQRVAPEVRRLAANTQSAVTHLLTRAGALWTPAYQRHAAEVGSAAGAVAGQIGQEEHMARLGERNASMEMEQAVVGK